MMVCKLPETAIAAFVEAFVQSAPLRQRFAFYDLEKAQKINLTRSEVFVYFERYLRRAHGMRIGPAPALTQRLEDSGILSLQMG